MTAQWIPGPPADTGRALMPRLLDRATAPYKPAGTFAWRFARGKLGGDPAFVGLLRLGLIPDHARILDLGCGQGLMPAWLSSARALYEAAQRGDAGACWPPGWPAAPRFTSYHGVELMPLDVDRANAAIGPLGLPARFTLGNICEVPFEPCDAVVILDVLHYIDYPAQEAVLAKVHAALAPRGRLLLRIGDAAAGLPFKISNWVDHVVTFVRGHRLPRLYCRSLADWQTTLIRLGFQVQVQPMHEGTPFANILLVAERR